MTPVYTTCEYFAGENNPNLRNLRKKSLAPMQYKKYVDITILMKTASEFNGSKT